MKIVLLKFSNLGDMPNAALEKAAGDVYQAAEIIYKLAANYEHVWIQIGNSHFVYHMREVNEKGCGTYALNARSNNEDFPFEHAIMAQVHGHLTTLCLLYSMVMEMPETSSYEADCIKLTEALTAIGYTDDEISSMLMFAKDNF